MRYGCARFGTDLAAEQARKKQVVTLSYLNSTATDYACFAQRATWIVHSQQLAEHRAIMVATRAQPSSFQRCRDAGPPRNGEFIGTPSSDVATRAVLGLEDVGDAVDRARWRPRLAPCQNRGVVDCADPCDDGVDLVAAGRAPSDRTSLDARSGSPSGAGRTSRRSSRRSRPPVARQ